MRPSQETQTPRRKACEGPPQFGHQGGKRGLKVSRFQSRVHTRLFCSKTGVQSACGVIVSSPCGITISTFSWGVITRLLRLESGNCFNFCGIPERVTGVRFSSWNCSEPFVKNDIQANGVLQGILLIIWKNQILPAVSETQAAQWAEIKA